MGGITSKNFPDISAYLVIVLSYQKKLLVIIETSPYMERDKGRHSTVAQSSVAEHFIMQAFRINRITDKQK